MATSPAYSTDNPQVKYTISVITNSQDINNDTSNVTVMVDFFRLDTGFATTGTGFAYCTINGTTYSAPVTPDQAITEAGVILFNHTLNVPHASDGTKTLTVSAWIGLDTLTSEEHTYNEELTPIPRATTPVLSDQTVALGDEITISLPRASEGFTHTLTYRIGNTSGTIGENLETSASWSPPLTLGTELPYTTSGIVTIICETYNEDAKIGAVAVGLIVTVPASVVPAVTAVTLTEGVSGLATKFGAFVQGQSEIQAEITADGAYGSIVANIVTTFGGASFIGANITIDKVYESGSVPLTVTVTDSRGRTTVYTQNVTVLPYHLPQILGFTGARCDSGGTADDTGQYVKLTYSYEISALGNANDKSIVIEYKQAGAASYTSLKSESSYSNTAVYIPASTFSGANIYQFRITASDYFGSESFELTVPAAFVLLDLSAGGRGLAIGKPATVEDLLDIGLPVSFSGSVWTDLTLDSGFVRYNNAAVNRPQYKAIGEMVFLRGIVSPASAYASSGTPVTIASGIPAALRPPYDQSFICPGSGGATWLCTVTTAGEVTISNYSGGTVPTDAKVAFAVSYAV